MNTTRLFNDGWMFGKRPLFCDIDSAAGGAWEKVDIPHDWLIGGADLYETGEGWYRRAFSCAPERGRVYRLRFEGAYMDSALFVNREAAYEWKYGYSTFEADITPFLRAGENEILVRTRHQSPNSRWYSGAGIYRNVYLKDEPRTRFVSDGLYLSARRAGADWALTVECETEGIDAPYTVAYAVTDADGNLVLDARGRGPRTSVALPNARAWDITDPYLYTLTAYLIVAGEAVCAQSARFGLRETAFDPDIGFLLNGRRVRLNGVCLHHDLGALGAAFNKDAARRQLEILRAMGVNAIRTAHNMPAPALMDLTDEMGVLVISEAFDMWERPKTEYDYARFFEKWYERDVASWIRRDRNHPSVILWSIGNEIYDTHADDRGLAVTRMLTGAVRAHDPLENARVTIGSNYMPWENAQKCADAVKIAGYNYAERYYDKHHRAHPDWVIYGSETSSIVQSRGVYHFPLSAPILADDDLQCSSLGNSITSWGARSYERCIADDLAAPYSLGQFVWSGFDYIGEPTPYHTRNSYFGLIDTAGFPKDAYYVFQAAWTEKPMVHLFPHWDWNEGQMIDVRAVSNAPRVKLFVNGERIGEYRTGDASGGKLIADARVPFMPGVVRAEAYGNDGRMVAWDERRTPGEAARLFLCADRPAIRANGRDMIFVTVQAVDGNGNPVDTANNRVRARVAGAARLIGMDNGDSTDGDPYQTDEKCLFSGKLLILLMARLMPGEICLTVESEGLAPASLTVLSRSCPSPEGVTAYLQAPSGARGSAGVPVRRVALFAPAGRALTPDAPEVFVAARALPPGCASIGDWVWRVTNDAGIDIDFAKARPVESGCAVRAWGDGDFKLRCLAANGSDHARVISELEFTARGFGRANLNPYRFLSAGLYTLHKGEVTAGNERGAATSREGETMIGFERLDFGVTGADTLTMPIFALDSETHDIELYDSVYGAGGVKIMTLRYQKPSRWNVYQAETWTLPARLTGVHTLCFVTTEKIHIKGFSFAPVSRAWDVNEAARCDGMYGDRFTVDGGRVMNIGNNVTLTYDGFVFDAPARAVTIRGRAHAKENGIRLILSGEGDPIVRQLAFTGDRAIERTFPLRIAAGAYALSFVFLPGSAFDFHWFRFERA